MTESFLKRNFYKFIQYKSICNLNMEAFELKWVNPNVTQYGVNLLKLEGHHIVYKYS